MKIKSIISKLIILFFLLGSLLVAQQQQNNQAANNATTAEQTASKDPLEKIILENFDEAEDWVAKATTPLGETKTLKLVQRGLMKDVLDPKTVPDDVTEETQANRVGKNHILGVKTYFNNRGFDRVELAPPHEFVIKGQARQISVWVLGRQFRHTLSAKFRDFKGKIHTVNFGRLDFFGWRKMTAIIPGFVPQSSRFALLDRNIRFISLFVTSDVHEVGGPFYFYVDDLQVRADKSELRYPGSEIKDNW